MITPLISRAGIVATLFMLTTSIAVAQEKEPSPDEASALDRIKKAANKVASKREFLLRYKFVDDQTIEWTVEHIATTKTSIAEKSETVSMRTNSTAAWKVISVDSYGRATLEKSLVKVNGWRKATDKEPVSFDSTSDKLPPREFESVAAMIDKPLMTVTVDRQGNVTDKKSSMRDSDFGIGETFLLLPDDAIKIGQKWYVPNQLTCFHADKRIKRVKIRKAYTLKEVNDNLATIEYRTEVLTPIDDPTIRSQISQHMTHGTVVLNVELGQIHSKSASWNQKVQGFHGPKSLSHYLGQYTATLNRPKRVSSGTAQVVSPIKSLKLKTHDGAPVFRR